MNRVAFILKVKQHLNEEYKVIHRHVWPEMLAALKNASWHNYSLFLKEDGLLFGYFETPDDFEGAQAHMASTEINIRWQTEMAPYFGSLHASRPDENLIQLEEVIYLDY